MGLISDSFVYFHLGNAFLICHRSCSQSFYERRQSSLFGLRLWCLYSNRGAWELPSLYTTVFKEDISNNGNCIKWVKPRLRDPGNEHVHRYKLVLEVKSLRLWDGWLIIWIEVLQREGNFVLFKFRIIIVFTFSSHL